MLNISKVFFGVFYFSILFAAILFLAYVSSKLIGSKMSSGMKGKHIKVVDSITLGFDRQIYLIKAGEQLLLIASSNKTIQFLTLIDKNMITITEEDLKLTEKEQKVTINNLFKNYLDIFKGSAKHKGNTDNELISDTETNRFKKNLNNLKDVFSKINSEKNGDEK